MNPAVADEALLAAMALGHQDAATLLVSRYRPRVFGLAVTLLSDTGAAEDVMQEAFLRAWRHAGSFDARRGSVATWLLAITRNLSLDALRAAGRSRSLPRDPQSFQSLQLVATDDVERAAVAGTEAVRVRQALATLAPEQARALVLATWYGATAAEIAAHDGIPLGTAKTRLRAGLIKLRAALLPDGEDVRP